MRTIKNLVVAFVVFCLLTAGSALGQEITISFIKVDAPEGATALGMRGEYPECRELSIPAYLEQFAELNGIENSEDGFRHIWPGKWMLPAAPGVTKETEIETVTLMVTPDATTQVLPALSDASTPTVETVVETAPAASEMWPTRLELALPNYDKLHSEVVGAHTRTHILTDAMNKPAPPARENIDEFGSLRQQEVDSLTAALLVSQTEIERQVALNEDLVRELAAAETKLALTETISPIVVEARSSATPPRPTWPWLAALCGTALMALLAIAMSAYLYRDQKRRRKKANELEERNALLAQGLEQSRRRTEEWKGRAALLEEDIAKHRHHFHLPGMKPEILRLPIKKIDEAGIVWVKLPGYNELVPTAMIEGALRHLNPKILQDLGIILPPATLSLPAREKLVLDFLKDPTRERAPTAV